MLRRFPDRFGIRCVSLIRLDKGFDEPCCNQTYLMIKPARHRCPVMRRTSSLHRYHSGCSAGKELCDAGPTEHVTLHLARFRFNPTYLENLFCQVQNVKS